jgi:hypothetical protein
VIGRCLLLIILWLLVVAVVAILPEVALVAIDQTSLAKTQAGEQVQSHCLWQLLALHIQ